MRLAEEIAYGIFWAILIGIIIFNANNASAIFNSIGSVVSTNVALLQGRPVTVGGTSYGPVPYQNAF